jgi:hypothetical protein
MRKSLKDFAALNAKITSHEEEAAVIAEMVKETVTENASTPQSQVEYLKKYIHTIQIIEKLAVAYHNQFLTFYPNLQPYGLEASPSDIDVFKRQILYLRPVRVILWNFPTDVLHSIFNISTPVMFTFTSTVLSPALSSYDFNIVSLP